MNHVHHWIIEPSNEKKWSKGVCKCGEIKQFDNAPVMDSPQSFLHKYPDKDTENAE